jgi:Amiloride-sensitive sodium channel
VANAGAFLLITQLYRKWDQNPVIVSFSTSATGITDIPFPAFTICNMNNIRKTVAKRILQRFDNKCAIKNAIFRQDV